MLPNDIDEEVLEHFHLITELVHDIDDRWGTVLRMKDGDLSSLCFFVYPTEEEEEDLEVSESHPDRVYIRISESGLLFSRTTDTIASKWMAAQLKQAPELMGCII